MGVSYHSAPAFHCFITPVPSISGSFLGSLVPAFPWDLKENWLLKMAKPLAIILSFEDNKPGEMLDNGRKKQESVNYFFFLF